MKTKFTLFLGAILLSAACTRPPQACFRTSIEVADINEEVEFLNCSLFSRHEQQWDFGDGSTSLFIDGKHAFADPGTYDVTLTVYGRTSSSDDVLVQPFYVGKRYLNSVNVLSLPAQKPDNTDWDAADAADPQFYARPRGAASWAYTSLLNSNLMMTAPYQWLESSATRELQPQIWDFLLLDQDGSAGVGDTMGFWSVDLDTIKAIGTFRLGNMVEIDYDVK